MQSSTAYQTSKNLAVLVVGEPKVGKTRLMMAFPDPFVLDLDKNLSSAVSINPNKKFWFAQVDDVPEGQRYDKIEKELKEAIASPDVKTICIDGVTQLAACVKQSIIAGLEKAGLGAKLRQDVLEPQIRLTDYDTLGSRFLRIVALTRASGKMVVWTSHQKVDKDEITGANRYRIHMPGNLADNLGGYFTDVWAMTATPQPGGKTKFEIRTKPTGYHVSLGCSIPLDPSIDITDKTPDQIWGILGPKLQPATSTPKP